jgi:hypothetical protein
MTSRRFAVVEVEHSIKPPAPVNRVPGEFVVKRPSGREKAPDNAGAMDIDGGSPASLRRF